MSLITLNNGPGEEVTMIRVKLARAVARDTHLLAYIRDQIAGQLPDIEAAFGEDWAALTKTYKKLQGAIDEATGVKPPDLPEA